MFLKHNKPIDIFTANDVSDLPELILEFLGETRIIIIIILIIIISAGTPLVSNSFHFSWNPKYIEVWEIGINSFWFPFKVE